LFTAYAPANAPTIAMAAAIEGGGYGASSAAPVVRKVFDAWLVGKMPVRIGPNGQVIQAAPFVSNTTATGNPVPTGSVTTRPDFSDVRGSLDAVPMQVGPSAPATPVPAQ
jgi:penicillin-binding protein 2